MATKPVPPRGPTDEELLAVGDVTPEQAPLDAIPLTEEERPSLEKRNPKWTDGDTVSAMIAARLRGG